MKNLSLILTILFFAGQIVFCQVPETTSFQGVLSNTDGSVVEDGNYNLIFKIYDSPSDGTMLWEETQIASTVSGIFNVMLGKVSVLNLPFDKPYWLEISIGGGKALNPRIELTSSFYSLMTKSIQDSTISTAKLQDNAVNSAKVSNNTITIDDILPNVLSSINGVSNDGGNVDIVAGSNVTITPDDVANTISISSTGGSGGGVSGNGTIGYLPKFSDSSTLINSIVYQNENDLGVGTSNPLASLHVNGVNGILFTGIFQDRNSSKLYLGEGTKMLWYPLKAAFRVGMLDSEGETFWNHNTIGDASFAAGYNTLALGECATAFGKMTKAEKQSSFAGGYNTRANGLHSFAFGTFSEALGNYSTVFGNQTKAQSVYSTAIGINNLGLGDPQNWIDNDPIFEIGIGRSPLIRSNALTVLKNGKVGIGTSTPQALLHVEGNNLAYLSLQNAGVYGKNKESGSYGYLGTNLDGVFGVSDVGNGSGVAGVNNGSGNGIYGRSFSGYAGKFEGDVNIKGSLSVDNGISNPENITIESQTNTVILKAGNTILTIDPSGAIHIQSSSDVQITTDANLYFTSQGDLNLTGKNINIDAANNVLINSRNDIGMQADRKVSLNANSNVSLITEADLTLQNNNALNVMKTNGDIDITGKNISIKASGELITKGGN